MCDVFAFFAPLRFTLAMTLRRNALEYAASPRAILEKWSPENDSREEERPISRDPATPEDRIQHARRASDQGASFPGAVGSHRSLSKTAGSAASGRTICFPRRASVRQRQYPHGSSHQQDPQRPGGSQPADGGARGAVRARLGLPRSAHRAQGHEGDRRERCRSRDHGDSSALPRLRCLIPEDPGRADDPARHLG